MLHHEINTWHDSRYKIAMMKLGSVGSLMVLLSALALGEAKAVPITGEVYFGSFRNVKLTGGNGDFATATGLDFYNSWDAIVGASSSGDFAPGIGKFATFYDFSFDGPGQPTDPLGLPTDIWRIAFLNFTFELASVDVERSTHGIILSGLGEVRSTTDLTKDATPGTFYFSLQGNDLTASSFSFSANSDLTSVPDGGASVVLLGFGLLGIASFRRMMAK